MPHICPVRGIAYFRFIAMNSFRRIFLLAMILFAAQASVFAQCSICTRTAQQQGSEAAEGLNGGIVYLMIVPLAVGGFIGYRWWKNEKLVQQHENQSS